MDRAVGECPTCRGLCLEHTSLPEYCNHREHFLTPCRECGGVEGRYRLANKLMGLCVVKRSFISHSGEKLGWKFNVENIPPEMMPEVYDALMVKPNTTPVGIPTGGSYVLKCGLGRRWAGTSVTLIDDVVTTGASMEAMTEELMLLKFWVVDKVCILNRSGGKYQCRALIYR